MRARTPMILVLTCALACATLVGCGQTGELTLPDQEGEVVSKGPDAAATTPEATDAAEAEAARKREAAVPTPAPK